MTNFVRVKGKILRWRGDASRFAHASYGVGGVDGGLWVLLFFKKKRFHALSRLGENQASQPPAGDGDGGVDVFGGFGEGDAGEAGGDAATDGFPHAGAAQDQAVAGGGDVECGVAAFDAEQGVGQEAFDLAGGVRLALATSGRVMFKALSLS